MRKKILANTPAPARPCRPLGELVRLLLAAYGETVRLEQDAEAAHRRARALRKRAHRALIAGLVDDDSTEGPDDE